MVRAKRPRTSGIANLFRDFDADVQETTIDEIVEEQKALAAQETLKMLRERGSRSFVNIWETILRGHMLRVTNVKDICVHLAKAGLIENTWGGGNRKPQDQDTIKLKSS